MDVTKIDITDDATVAELLDLHRVQYAADQPEHPAPCSQAFGVDVQQPRPRQQEHHRVVRVDGRIVGHVRIALPTQDNLHFSTAQVIVHPTYRRRGLGRALMTAAMALAWKHERRVIGSSALRTWGDGPERSVAGARFLESFGFTPALTEVLSVTDLWAMDPDEEQRLYDEALAKSTGYETIGWTGRVPEELLAGVAGINSTFLDEAPLGELDLEAEQIDADVLREHDDGSIARGIFMTGVVARHLESGDVAANTVIGVAKEPGDFAGQWITIVSPRHRGHRLGMRIKVENHRQLRRERPAVRWVGTGNADVNDPMLAINRALGFRPMDASVEFQRKL